MWHDNETIDDLLGFRVHVDVIKSVITDHSVLPITIGLFGNWGSGKTSIMKMLQTDLNIPTPHKDKEVVYIYFNSWLFEGYDDAKSAILSSILLQLAEHKRIGPLLKEKALKLLKSVDWMRVGRFAFSNVAVPALLTYLTGGQNFLPSIATTGSGLIGTATSKSDPKDDDNVQEKSTTERAVDSASIADAVQLNPARECIVDIKDFRLRFSDMLSESKVDILIVMIDDLDRCSPKRIVENLEAIKLFLNVEQSAFIIGADARIIEHAVGTMFTDDEHKKELISDYVEKVVQVPYHIPWLSPSEVTSYISLLFCKKYGTEEIYKKCFDAFRNFRKTNLRETFGYARIKEVLNPEEFASVGPKLLLCNEIASLITDGLKGNPRQIKRFLNAYTLRKQLASLAGLSIRDDILIKLMILEYISFDRFNELFMWQAVQKGIPKELELIESPKEPEHKDSSLPLPWNTEKIIAWANMNPKLAGLDLSDYFWVSRDKLASTISDAALVPPIVRKILDGLVSSRRPEKESSCNLCKQIDPQFLTMVLDRLLKPASISPEGAAMLALFDLCESGIQDADSYLAEALTQAATEQIPPTLGPRLKTIIRNNKQSEEKFKKVFEKHGMKKTAFSRAIRDDVSTKTQGGSHGHIT